VGAIIFGGVLLEVCGQQAGNFCAPGKYSDLGGGSLLLKTRNKGRIFKNLYMERKLMGTYFFGYVWIKIFLLYCYVNIFGRDDIL